MLIIAGEDFKPVTLSADFVADLKNLLAKHELALESVAGIKTPYSRDILEDTMTAVQLNIIAISR
jgi:hypothetical protein